MKTNETIRPRRTVLTSIASVAIALLSGCSDSLARSPKATDQSDVFERVAVEGVDLVVEFSSRTVVEQVTVIQPNGELFAKRSIAQGVTRETIRLGTNYEPGEYEVLGLEGDTTVERTIIEIRPDIRIMDVKLARNHPEEMFEGADDFDIESEAIVQVQNHGSGPDAITELRFMGDIPRPTPDSLRESGIHDTENEFSRYADEVFVPPTKTRTLYSNVLPFLSIGGNVSCKPTTVRGEFTVTIRTQIGEKDDSISCEIEYTGTDLSNCEIAIVEDSS